MFKMVNRYGNAVCFAKTESEKRQFISRGFHEVKEETEVKEEKNTTAVKRAAPKKNTTPKGEKK